MNIFLGGNIPSSSFSSPTTIAYEASLSIKANKKKELLVSD